MATKGKIKRTSGAAPGPARQTGPRFKCGKLKPRNVAPNEKVMAMRQATGITDADLRLGPIRYAYTKGWLEHPDMVIADVYADAYQRARLGSPGVSAQRDEDAPGGAASGLHFDWSSLTDEEARKVSWTEFTSKELAAVWDSAFRPQASGEKGSGALKKWKGLAMAVTPAERNEIDKAVLQGVWPQWLLSRILEQATGPHENQRLLLVSGLKRMHRAWGDLKRSAQAANDHHGNDNASGQIKRDVA